MTDSRARLPLLSIGLISAATLGTEIVLTRAFAIVHWHHFAAMVVSLALLGFGASGTLLTLARRRLLARFGRVYPASLLACAAAALVCPPVAQRLPLRAEALLWDPWQPLWLLLVYLVLSIPFFFAGMAIGLALCARKAQIGRVYAADLAGAGLGSLAALGALYLVPPDALLRVVAIVAATAAVTAAHELESVRPRWLIGGGVVIAIALLLPSDWLRFEPGPYKALSQMTQVTGSEIVLERSSPLGRLDVVAHPRVPLRYAPGLSLTATGEPPAQLALFTDGDAMDAITGPIERPEQATFLEASTLSLPYVVGTPRRVLVVESGGGLELMRARVLGAAQVDGLALNRDTVALLREDLAAFTGHLTAQPGIDLHVGEARGWLEGTERRYDLIVLPAGTSAASGVGGLTEDYLRTVEAIALYLAHLAPGGWLSMTGPVQLPPRQSLKLVATVRAAFEARGVVDPGDRLLMIRRWQTWTLIARNGPVTEAEIARLRGFAQRSSFDLVWHIGLDRADTNRFNQLSEPYFHDGVRALLGEGHDAFIRDYAYALEPATDERPYVQHVFRWGLLDDVLSSRERGGMALLEAGYLLLCAITIQAVIAGAVLILLPLAIGASVRDVPVRHRWRVFGYFAALGIAFLFIEIAFLNRSMLLVHQPTAAFALTIATFLIGAGFGSAWSANTSAGDARRVLVIATLAIVALAVIDVWMFRLLEQSTADWPVLGRAAAAAALLLPLAFCMGVPFPVALRRIDAALTPWAWGINGCASVVSAASAALLAVEFGFAWLVWIAAACYAIAPWLLPVARSNG